MQRKKEKTHFPIMLKKSPTSSWQHHDFSVMFTTENEIIRSSWRQIYRLWDTTENIKKRFFVSGQGETTWGFWGYGFYQKKVISDQSRCYIPLEYKPLSFLHKSSFLPKNLIFDRSVTRSEIVFWPHAMLLHPRSKKIELILIRNFLYAFLVVNIS